MFVKVLGRSLTCSGGRSLAIRRTSKVPLFGAFSSLLDRSWGVLFKGYLGGAGVFWDWLACNAENPGIPLY